MTVHPGAPPFGWDAEGAGTCKRSGLPLPPRAMWVRSADEVILGFDHYCFWIRRPIGLQNRKFFVLFLCWSCLLCMVGAFAMMEDATVLIDSGLSQIKKISHPYSYSELLAGETIGSVSQFQLKLCRLLVVSFESSRIVEALLPLLTSVIMSQDLFDFWRRCFVFVLLVADVVVGTLLLVFGVWHITLAARGRTTLDVSDDRYDVGWLANLRQVFGVNIFLWPFPLQGSGPSVDGLFYPEREDCRLVSRVHYHGRS